MYFISVIFLTNYNHLKHNQFINLLKIIKLYLHISMALSNFILFSVFSFLKIIYVYQACQTYRSHAALIYLWLADSNIDQKLLEKK